MQKTLDKHQWKQEAPETPHRVLYWLLILFLVLEYIRPPVLPQLKLQFLIILLLALALLVSKDRPWSSIMLGMFLFFAVNAKGLPFALNNYSVYMASRFLFGYIVIAFSLAWLMSWHKSFRQLMWIWVMIVAYAPAYALTNGGRGPGGMLADENDLALALCATLPITLFGIDYLTGWRRWASLGLALLFTVGVIVSFSRGGFIGLAVVGMHYFFSSGAKARKLLVVGAAISAFLAFAPPKYLEEMRTIQQDANVEKTLENEQDSTAVARFFLWSIAIEMWKAHPIMGVGGRNFGPNAGLYQPTTGNWPSHYFERGWGGTSVHSTYFQLLAEHGVPGVLLFVYILWVYFRTLRSLPHEASTGQGVPHELRRDIQFYSSALTGGMMGFLACAVFLAVLYYPHFWYLCGMAVGLEAAFRREVARRADFDASDDDGPRQGRAQQD